MDVNKNFKLSSVSKKEELEIIKALPSNFVSVSKPSKRIDNLLAKRKNEHETAILVMQDALRETNLSIAEEMRRDFAVLQKRIGQLNDRMEMIINSEIKDEDIDVVGLTKEVFGKTMEKIDKINSKQIKIVEDFHRDLVGLEKKRSEGFVAALKECYAKLNRIYYKLPHDLQDYFEHEILKINQTTLANHRCYEQIRFHFKSQIQNALRLRINELMECEKNADLARQKSELRDIIHRKISSIPKLQDFFDIFGKSRNTSEDTDNEVMGFATPSSQAVDLWTSQTQKTLDFLENHSKKLVDLFKGAVMLVFNKFFEELQNMEVVVAKTAKANESSLDINLDVSKEIFDPIIENLVETYGCDLEEIKNLWNNITEHMEQRIVETYRFLNSCMNLFDKHFKRLNVLQTLILKDLKNVIQKNDWDCQVSEKKINKAIDQLRQESSQVNLDKLLKDADKLLDSIAKTYSVQCQKEKKVIGKYKDIAVQEIDLVIAETERFLNEHKNTEKDPTIQRKRGSQISISEEAERRDKLIPHQMKQCQFQVDTIFNWMFGLWEGIKLYLKECREDMSQKANAWSDKQVQKIGKRLEVKMAIHIPRYHRIRHVIYDKRLEEINTHLAKLRFLEEAASKEFETSKEVNLSERAQNNSIVTTYVTCIGEIETKMYQAQNVHQIQAYMHSLNVRTNEALTALAVNIEESESSGKTAQNRIDEGISSFLRSIKLFGEGGNYSAAEVDAVRKRVKAMIKNVPKKFSGISLEAKKDTAKASEEVRKLDSLLRSKLVRSKEEFDHNEWTISKIRQLKNAIHHQVYDAKCKLRRVEAYTEAFEDSVMNSTLVGAEANYKSILRHYKEAVAEVDKLMQFFIRPNVKEFKSKTVVKSKDSIANYVDEMFHIIPIAEDGSYASTLSHLIYESLVEVQNQAKTFYKDHTTIINQGRVQTDFNAFMDEVLATYLSYQLQCEYNWLECLNHLICLNLDALEYIDRSYERTIKEYLNEGLAKFISTCDEIRRKVGQEKRRITDEYANIKEKTECYLDDIENVLNRIHDDVKKRIEELIIVPYKEQLESDFKRIKDESKMIHENFQALFADEALKSYTATLLDEFKDGIELIDNLLDISLLDLSDDREIAVHHNEHDSIISDTVRKVSLLKNWFESLKDEIQAQEERQGIVVFIKSNHQQLLHEYNKIIIEFNKITAWINQMHTEYKHLFVEEPQGESQ